MDMEVTNLTSLS